VFPKALSNTVVADEGVLRTPEGRRDGKSLRNGSYAHRCQADRASGSRRAA
jgi:hypothetical protein